MEFRRLFSEINLCWPSFKPRKVKYDDVLFIQKQLLYMFNFLRKKYTYSCMLYFVGKTGFPIQGILTSNAFSFNLKICIYIYVEHKYPERRTI
jgi:hypothetical protein